MKISNLPLAFSSYAMEREENFRWLSQLFAARAPRPLGLSDRTDPSLQLELSEIGQFAELAHGSFDLQFIWKYMENLCTTGYPLHQYSALLQSTLLSIFHGTTANLQSYIAYRHDKEQLVVAFSGTCSLVQAGQALDARLVPYQPSGRTHVHAGFWRMYQGIQAMALSQLREAMTQYPDVREVVLTGHSMGAVMAYLLCMDIYQGRIPQSNDDIVLPPSVKVVAFGAPRVGDDALVQLWKHLTNKPGFKDYSVRCHRDGITAVPPYYLGFRHLSQNPFYFSHSQLWHILSDQSEYSSFELDPAATVDTPNLYPLGGHNFYNDRDIQLLQRQMKWFEPHLESDTWNSLRQRFEDRKNHGP